MGLFKQIACPAALPKKVKASLAGWAAVPGASSGLLGPASDRSPPPCTHPRRKEGRTPTLGSGIGLGTQPSPTECSPQNGKADWRESPMPGTRPVQALLPDNIASRPGYCPHRRAVQSNPPQTGQLLSAETASLTVPEARSQKSRCGGLPWWSSG